MKVLFTDLDGTLLDARTYSFEAARPALDTLRQKGVPLVICTSKTRAEVELWRTRLGIDHPFIVENGGAVYIPKGYFPFKIPNAIQRNNCLLLEFGTPYEQLVAALKQLSRETGCETLGFSSMSVAELSLRSLLPIQQAELAKRREYDEAFEILSSGSYRLLEAIERRGLKWTRGDRFYHIMGSNDKASAVARLVELYRKAHGDILTIGVGDGWNDVRFLSSVDVPVLVRSRFDTAIKRAEPRCRVTDAPGPHGWNTAVLDLLAA
ncbi:MAG: HAD-IIB family hydrolase [Acidobacteriales bacterium]|nr:HAD-IIB family hydrolase [Terriglobales bacterium]